MDSTKPTTTSIPTLHGSEPVSTAIVSAVADAEGVSPLDLRPLATVVDPDALNGMVASMAGQPDDTGIVEFAYSGYDVTVTRDGRVDLDERTD